MHLTEFVLLFAALITGLVLFHNRIRTAPAWLATVTPLASIIGSGFLIAAPLIAVIVGRAAPLVMLVIIVIAYGIGSIIRFNIRNVEPILAKAPDGNRAIHSIEQTASFALAAAYIISVAFYLRLLSSFVLHPSGNQDPVLANLLTTGILIFIGVAGATRGLRALEKLEAFSVTIKLAIIAALVAGLWVFDLDAYAETINDTWPEIKASHFEQIRLLAGMLLIVQGFETSRYLGAAYDPEVRVRTMRLAQILSGIIYVVFVLLAIPILTHLQKARPDETAIIELTGVVSPILPAMLVIAAAMSQFSAAVADTVGAGGLIEETSKGRLRARWGYLVIAAFAIVLVWTANIFEIISIASRAFAAYYLLQGINAFLAVGPSTGSSKRKLWRRIQFGSFIALLVFVVVFGRAAE